MMVDQVLAAWSWFSATLALQCITGCLTSAHTGACTHPLHIPRRHRFRRIGVPPNVPPRAMPQPALQLAGVSVCRPRQLKRRGMPKVMWPQRAHPPAGISDLPVVHAPDVRQDPVDGPHRQPPALTPGLQPPSAHQKSSQSPAPHGGFPGCAVRGFPNWCQTRPYRKQRMLRAGCLPPSRA